MFRAVSQKECGAYWHKRGESCPLCKSREDDARRTKNVFENLEKAVKKTHLRAIKQKLDLKSLAKKAEKKLGVKKEPESVWFFDRRHTRIGTGIITYRYPGDIGHGDEEATCEVDSIVKDVDGYTSRWKGIVLQEDVYLTEEEAIGGLVEFFKDEIDQAHGKMSEFIHNQIAWERKLA